MSDSEMLDLERRVVEGELDLIPSLVAIYVRQGLDEHVLVLWNWYQKKAPAGRGVPVELLWAAADAEKRRDEESERMLREEERRSFDEVRPDYGPCR